MGQTTRRRLLSATTLFAVGAMSAGAEARTVHESLPWAPNEA